MRTQPHSTAEPPRPARPWPARTVRFATLTLPRGPLRDRYRQEFLAELYGQPSGEQARLARGILTHSLALRSAVRGAGGSVLEDAMSTPSKPLLCRTNLRHTWEWAHTPDGQRFIRCRRCLKEKDDGPNWRVMATGGPM